MRKGLVFTGMAIVGISLIFGFLNYFFHTPQFRPEWFSMTVMMSLIQWEIIFTVVGLAIISFGVVKK